MSDKSVEKQFYRVLWKGRTGITKPSWNSTVPTWSRPNINGVQPNPNDYQSPFGTPRPSKTWRKQLAPTPFSGKGKATLDLVNAPGGTTSVQDVSDCVYCIQDASLNPLSIKNVIDGNFSFLTPQTPNQLYNNAEEYNVPSENIYDKCISCDPVSNRIRSATTVLSKKYYSDTKGYLQSRCQRFIQKYTPEQIPGIQYGYDVWPSDTPTGTQNYLTPNCPAKCQPGGSNVLTIYKPNNKKYGVQGAVDSSTRLQKIKVDMVNKNAASFKASFGGQGVSAASYKPTGDAPFFVKSNLNHCQKQVYHRNGNPTMCFKTPVADMYHQSLTTIHVYPRPSKTVPTTTYPTA